MRVLNVPFEMRRACQPNAADRAHVRSVSGVSQEMLLQIAPCDESFTTSIAFKVFLARVPPEIIFKGDVKNCRLLTSKYIKRYIGYYITINLPFTNLPSKM